MKIDPYAWLLTVPLTIAMVQIWFLPREHAIKRLWHSMQEAESDVWCRLHGGTWRPDPGRLPGAAWINTAMVYHGVLAVFAATSLASFASFLDVLPG